MVACYFPPRFPGAEARAFAVSAPQGAESANILSHFFGPRGPSFSIWLIPGTVEG